MKSARMFWRFAKRMMAVRMQNALAALFLTFAPLPLAAQETAPAPAPLFQPAEPADPAAPPRPPARSCSEALARFLGQPFRVDGAQDNQGRWVTFNEPDRVADTPGFNCSGFTVAAAREILGRDFTLAEAARDRRGDSGPGAALGQDWDFGLDLVLNLAQDCPHRFLPEPDGPDQPPIVRNAGRRPLGWGVDVHSPRLEEIFGQIQPGRFCFFVLSKPDRRFPAGVSYYHVGLIVSEPPALWLYQTTAGARTNRVNLATPEGLARFRRDFKPIPNAERRLFLVEVER